MMGAPGSSVQACLERFGADKAYRRVTPLAIVEDFDELEDRRPGLLARGVALLMHQLAFEGSEEALHRSVVITVSFSAHGTSHPLPRQQGLILPAGVLHAAIAVVQQVACGTTPR